MPKKRKIKAYVITVKHSTKLIGAFPPTKDGKLAAQKYAKKMDKDWRKKYAIVSQ